MKSYAIILSFAFVWQSSNAIRNQDLRTCSVENGLVDDTYDLRYLKAIDIVNNEKTKDVPKDKIAGAIVCMFRKQFGERNLNTTLQNLIERDDKVTEEVAKKMLETLDTCNTDADGDDSKLLNCVNILAHPFYDLFAVLRDVPGSVGLCNAKCAISIVEMYKIEENHKLEEILKHVSEEKMGCIVGCQLDLEQYRNSDGFTPSKRISEMINNSKIHDENEKKEMMETLDKCSTQVAGIDGETRKLIKCIDLFKPPFINLYPNRK